MADNPVDKLNILKEQSRKERKARVNWQRKWGYHLDFKRIIKEEAEKLGFTEEEFYEKVSFKKPQPKYDSIGWDIEEAGGVPRTSSGVIGWRGDLKYSLEKVGPMFVSPLHTMPKKEKQNFIILG
ncbi:uncharacterized protein LOC123307489 [Coccinella septempunctata]|uniref:uncharacterized protein LOC123307489 n=1 Tax=Coccinella septempunctata TaxID=41139 RepID=UPI001D072AE7|nr:uncharacterized protein LOC123307489 [Coccinella septempunctata]